jgi:hypothetical protein
MAEGWAGLGWTHGLRMSRKVCHFLHTQDGRSPQNHAATTYDNDGIGLSRGMSSRLWNAHGSAWLVIGERVDGLRASRQLSLNSLSRGPY